AESSRPNIPERPWGEMLAGGVGYIGFPPCGSGDPAVLADYARRARDLLAGLAAQGSTRWVVDIRLNGGGNVWPMLVGLQPLLGDGPMFRSLQPRADRQTFGLDGAEGWLETAGGRVVNFALADAPVPARDLRGDRV